MKVLHTDEGIAVKFDYGCKDFTDIKDAVKSCGARWNPSLKQWELPEEKASRLLTKLATWDFKVDGKVDEIALEQEDEPDVPGKVVISDDSTEIRVYFEFGCPNFMLIKESVKDAGAKWEPEEKYWHAPIEQSEAIIAITSEHGFTTPEGIGKSIEEMKAKKEQAIAASRASAADIELPRPEGLDYFPFQKAGIVYSVDKDNVLIGDEMGLGKTIQALGVINAKLLDIDKVLIVCPASLKLNWQREAEKWLIANYSIGIAQSTDIPDTNIVIINWDILTRNQERLTAKGFDLAIMDEVHYAKNSKAQRTKAIKAITANMKQRIALTGTPIVNRPAELFSILELLQHPLAKNFWHYMKRYANAHNNGYGWDFSGASNLDELQENLRSTVMVRRLKKDVLTELPPKRRQIIEYEFEEIFDTGWREQVYLEQQAMKQVNADIEEAEIQRDLAEATDDQDAYQQAVARLQKARQVQFTEMARLRHETALAKVPAVVDHVITIMENEQKVVVFAHHHDVINELMDELEEYNPVKLTGEDTAKQRDEAVRQFQEDSDTRVFVGSIQAAGVGLTLTAASTVIFAELDWVPGNMSQAEDRLHRIGQHDSVMVYHIVLDGSLDANLAKTIVAKQEIIDKALDIETPEQEPLEIITPPKHPQEDLSEEQISAIHQGLKSIAMFDTDRAEKLNMVGFNRIDTDFGNDLAERPTLTQKQANAAKRMLKKYHRQLGEALYNEIFA